MTLRYSVTKVVMNINKAGVPVVEESLKNGNRKKITIVGTGYFTAVIEVVVMFVTYLVSVFTIFFLIYLYGGNKRLNLFNKICWHKA